MKRYVRTPQVVLATLLALCMLYPAVPAHAAALCFGETGQCIADPFTNYWQGNGGLPVFGFPTATMVPETSPDSGRVYLTQWYERNRLERHPENAAPYDVLLGRLGEERLRQQGRDWRSFPKADPNEPHYYAQTGHAIADEFWAYWSGHGLDLGDPGISERESLALFGYPLSEPASERNAAGDTVLTQWFERARFEYHPNNPDPYKVLLGLLGVETRPVTPPAQPFYENRAGSPVEFLASYYNAVNRGEYERAYNYWESHTGGANGSPTDPASFAAGFAQTASVAVTFGTPVSEGAAGSTFASVPAAIIATAKDGSISTFGGCYVVRRTNAGIDPDPAAVLWRMYSAAITPGSATATAADLLPATCQP
jgi:hypothetical protein